MKVHKDSTPRHTGWDEDDRKTRKSSFFGDISYDVYVTSIAS
jgi:hypothetical protein